MEWGNATHIKKGNREKERVIGFSSDFLTKMYQLEKKISKIIKEKATKKISEQVGYVF